MTGKQINSNFRVGIFSALAVGTVFFAAITRNFVRIYFFASWFVSWKSERQEHRIENVSKYVITDWQFYGIVG
jgi:hypothetical protein